MITDLRGADDGRYYREHGRADVRLDIGDL
jgi:hypothetical protein